MFFYTATQNKIIYPCPIPLVNRSISIELTNLQDVRGDFQVKENLTPAAVTKQALEKIKSDIFNMATAITAPVKRTVTWLDKIGKFFSDLVTAIKNRFSESFNKKTMTRKFDAIFDNLQVRLTMPHEDGSKQIPKEIQSLKEQIDRMLRSGDLENLCSYYENADEPTKRELIRAFTGRPVNPAENPPEKHPLKKYLTTVKQSLDNLSNIQKAVFGARKVLARRRELKSKPNDQNAEDGMTVLENKAHEAAVKLWENRQDNGIYDYGNESCRGNSNGHMHEDLYLYMDALFRKLLNNRSNNMANYSLKDGNLTLVDRHS